ncbi:iron chaperone [Lacticigenium naphthae]|uniref:iron chaperone n=1 Tax=Lacticigenium naphthae TaxID=515351 RepID=UPI0003F5AAAF|nr:DUF1801 domain-containing protein [Lacticigenium naphthae]
MKEFEEFLSGIEEGPKRERMEEILRHIAEKYPHMEKAVKWNQPMFVDHGTFIIAFSVAKPHIAVAPEARGIQKFAEEFDRVGYSYSKQLFRIKWNEAVDFELLDKIIAFNIEDKIDSTKFWR